MVTAGHFLLTMALAGHGLHCLWAGLAMCWAGHGLGCPLNGMATLWADHALALGWPLACLAVDCAGRGIAGHGLG
jgi:hypothetical protein